MRKKRIKKKKRLSRNVKDWLKGLGITSASVLALYFSIQTPLYVSDQINKFTKSELREEFEEEFGIELLGPRSIIESDGESISSLSAVLHRERYEGGLDLESIRIESDWWINQSMEWRVRNMWGSISGMYHEDNIHLLDNFIRSTVHHEIKHDKARLVMDTYPEFTEKWLELTLDENDNSMYLSDGWRDATLSPELGFVSEYARRNIHEDIAELCEETIWNEDNFIDLIENSPLIKAKVELAEEYGLIPKEFSEYTKLKELYKDASNVHNLSSDTSKMDLFFEASESFLEDNPKTVYEAEILYRRAELMRDIIGPVDEKFNPLNEHLKILDVEYKDPEFYADSLEAIGYIYGEMGDEINSNLFKEAYFEYWRRFDIGGINLSLTGVNDLLR